MTIDQYSEFEAHVAMRIATESKFSLHPDEITRKFQISQPFWKELDKLARIRRQPDFVFNPHHWSGGEPTEIVFERRNSPDETLNLVAS